MTKVQINIGGGASAPWLADATVGGGGSTTTNAATPTTTGILDPPPDAIIQAVHYALTPGQNIPIPLTGLTPNGKYIFRVFSCWHSTGSWAYKIEANSILKGNVYHTANIDDDVLKVFRFPVTADGSGNINLLITPTTLISVICAVEYWEITGGSTVPANVTGFTATALPAGGVQFAYDDTADDVGVDHYHIEADTVNTYNSPDLLTFDTWNDLRFATSLDPSKSYFCRIQAVDGDGMVSAAWTNTTVTTSAAAAQLNVGGGAVAGWLSDGPYCLTPATVHSPGTVADTSGLTDPAPDEIYESLRLNGSGSLDYRFPGLRPNASYKFRTHYRIDSAGIFTEYTTVGDRTVTLLSYDTADVAHIREFYANADSEGVIETVFHAQIGGYSYLAGIEFERAARPTETVAASIVVGFHSIPGGQPYYEDSYPGHLATLLSANYWRFDSPIVYDSGASARVCNVAIAGQSTANFTDRFAADVAARFDPGALVNILVIDGAANDVYIYDGATIESRIAALCAAGRSAGYNKIIVSTMTKRSDGTGAQETARTAFNTLVRANWATYADGLVDYDSNTALDYTITPANFSYESAKVHYSAPDGNLVAAGMLYDVVLPMLPPPAITDTNPLTGGVVGTPLTHQLHASGGTGIFTWSKTASSPGVSINSSGLVSDTDITTIGPRTITAVATDSADSASSPVTLTWLIHPIALPPPVATIQVQTFGGYEILALCSTPMSESIEFNEFRADMGDGYIQKALFGSYNGLRNWSLTFQNLHGGSADYDISGLSSEIMNMAKYIWDLFCKCKRDGIIFIIKSSINDQYYLADFVDKSLTFDRMLVKLFTAQGIKLTQVRVAGVSVYNHDNTIDLGFNSTVVPTSTGDVITIETPNGKSASRLNNTLTTGRIYQSDGFSDSALYDIFLVMRCRDTPNFSRDEGLLSTVDSTASILFGANGTSKFETGLNPVSFPMEYRLDGIKYALDNMKAPMNRWGVVHLRMMGGYDLSTHGWQIGRIGTNTSSSAKIDIAAYEFVNAPPMYNKNMPLCDALEYTEYLATIFGLM